MRKSILKALGTTLAALCFAGILRAQVPNLIHYQGRVVVSGVNFDGAGQFKFALVNSAGTTTFWSNDGTSVGGSQPNAAITQPVAKGLYSILLGDTSVANMALLPASVFANPDVRLRIWFNNGALGFQQLAPDQRLAPQPYLADGAVTTAKIASGAVTNTQLSPNAVQAGNIAPGAVGPAQVSASIPVLTNAGNTFTGSLAVSNGLSVSGLSTFANDLTVNGLIRSSTNGVMFPDLSIQKSASSITSFVNVRSYGATGDGAIDDTTAFVAAFQAIRGNGGGTLFVPKGVYRLTSQLSIDVSVSLVGEGRRLSILRWSAANGGIRFEGGAVGGRLKRTFAMASLGLTTAASPGGRAIDASSTVGIGNIGKTLEVRDCDFYTDSPSAYWDCGLWLDDIRDTTITNCDFRGRELPFDPGGFGIRIGGSRFPTGHYIDNCLFAGLDTAIDVVGTIEGVVVSKCGTVGKRGVVWETEQPRPVLIVTDSHFDTTLDGVFMRNCTDAFIHHCSFYPRAGNASTRAGVDVGNSMHVRISDCTFERNNEPDNYNAILAVAGANYTRIERNTIVGARTGIWLTPGSQDSYVLDNDFSLCFTQVFNQGTATRLRETPQPLP